MKQTKLFLNRRPPENPVNPNIFCYRFEGLGWIYERDEGYLVWAFDGPNACKWVRLDDQHCQSVAEWLDEWEDNGITAHSRLEMVIAVGSPEVAIAVESLNEIDLSNSDIITND